MVTTLITSVPKYDMAGDSPVAVEAQSAGCDEEAESSKVEGRVACYGYAGFATISQNTNITAVNAGTPSQNHSRA